MTHLITGCATLLRPFLTEFGTVTQYLQAQYCQNKTGIFKASLGNIMRACGRKKNVWNEVTY